VCLVFMGVTSMWIMWVCVYMHQMTPLIYPLIPAIAKDEKK